mmetsp:Transcript_17543/g.33267  ORF Transcript_17543/g.33267 Transcript_17543/m.33267 type:complete len:218 (+) Transcript_17543:748-1401(+)
MALSLHPRATSSSFSGAPCCLIPLGEPKFANLWEKLLSTDTSSSIFCSSISTSMNVVNVFMISLSFMISKRISSDFDSRKRIKQQLYFTRESASSMPSFNVNKIEVSARYTASQFCFGTVKYISVLLHRALSSLVEVSSRRTVRRHGTTSFVRPSRRRFFAFFASALRAPHALTLRPVLLSGSGALAFAVSLDFRILYDDASFLMTKRSFWSSFGAS